MDSQSWSNQLEIYDSGSWYDSNNYDTNNEQLEKDVIEFHIMITLLLVSICGLGYSCKYVYKNCNSDNESLKPIVKGGVI